ncbi:MAG: hypothetical protein FWD61_04310 [Phycisphaerales bacterium]|nr:hypothetical protein [Phycisphaerales bacterium]
MTVAEQIESRIAKLQLPQQRALLTFLDTLEPAKLSKPALRRKGKSRKAEVNAALRAIAGMWKDRTDLPKDGAAASMVLRRRVMGRSEND